MARRFFSLITAVLLIGCLAFSSFAVDAPVYDFADSGVQVFALQDQAPVTLASPAVLAASSGNYGYTSESFNFDYKLACYPGSQNVKYDLESKTYLPVGLYVFRVDYDSSDSLLSTASNFDWKYGFATKYISSGNTVYIQVDVTKELTEGFYLGLRFLPGVDVDFESASCIRYSPVDGISSGFSGNYIGGQYANSAFRTISVPFGNQPAGDYLINIYHWSTNADVDFSLEYNGRRLSTSTDGGVTTSTVSHGGGNLTISGSFSIYRRPEREVYENSSGNIHALSLQELAFYITDVVAVPLSDASVEQYGIFGSIVGFFRDQTSDIKSFFSGLFRKYFSGDESGEFDQSASQAESIVNQQKELEDQIIGDFSQNADKVDPSTITIPNDVLSGFVFIADLFTLVFNGLGNYKVLITVSLCLGIASIFIGRGFNAAGRALSVSNRRSRANSAKKGGAT